MNEIKYWKVNIISTLTFLLICFFSGESFALTCETQDDRSSFTYTASSPFLIERYIHSSNFINSSGNRVVVMSFYVSCWNVDGAIYVNAIYQNPSLPSGVYGTVSFGNHTYSMNHIGMYNTPIFDGLSGTVKIELTFPPRTLDLNAFLADFMRFMIGDDSTKRNASFPIILYIHNTNADFTVKTCDVNQGSQTITLPDYDENIDNRVPINISVNCNYSSSLSFSLSGRTDGSDQSIYLNSAGNGAAQNLGVSFYYNGSKVLNNHTIKVSDSTTNGIINLSAGYAKMPGVVTAGVVMAKATLTITYN
ncbi:hypothetical protein DU195_22995 [Salmonella enterica subsp. enterica serovar Telhashomer]|nr:hypothetical protein [Salmonella enterica subsp. enterica serovar Telhashomer]EBQ1658450.1 fimbrial protein [Salmonella enterica]EEC1060768.1 fimbrial protein [Salmonella enterica subsp. enterica]EBQ1830221.1 fimbrial protein [Salmonella enterica]EBQ4336479.1 fimbrial protein [Salmonella enterica]